MDQQMPISTTISPTLALFINVDILSMRNVYPDWVLESILHISQSLNQLMRANSPQRWTLSLRDMKMVLIYLLVTIEDKRDKHQTTPEGMTELAKDLAPKIMKLDPHYPELVKQIAPSVNMEILHGIDPLQGTIGIHRD